MQPKDDRLTESEQQRVREMIAARGVEPAAATLAVPVSTLARAAAGCRLRTCSRDLIRAALAARR